MPTDSHYAAHCREVLTARAKTMIYAANDFGQQSVRDLISELLEAYEQQARIAEIRRVKLEHTEEALRKRREQVQKGRLMLLNAARSLQSYDASYGGGGGDSEAWAIADFCGYDPEDSRADSDLEDWLRMQLMKETIEEHLNG